MLAPERGKDPGQPSQFAEGEKKEGFRGAGKVDENGFQDLPSNALVDAKNLTIVGILIERKAGGIISTDHLRRNCPHFLQKNHCLICPKNKPRTSLHPDSALGFYRLNSPELLRT